MKKIPIFTTTPLGELGGAADGSGLTLLGHAGMVACNGAAAELLSARSLAEYDQGGSQQVESTGHDIMIICAQVVLENQWVTLAVILSLATLVVGSWAVLRFKKGRRSD